MFHPDVFGDLSIEVVLQALEQGQKMRRQDAHVNELGVATLTSCFVNANRDPKKGKPAKPSDFFYFANADSIASGIADAFFSLITDKLMPSWAVHAAPMDLLRQAKTTGTHRRFRRALQGEGVMIFCPDISTDGIYSDFVIYNEADWGWVEVKDVDSQKSYEVFVVPADYDQQYCRDVTLDRR